MSALQKRPGSGFGSAAFVAGLQHAEPWALNTTTHTLATCLEWGLLLSRAGDILVLHVLVHGSLFAPLGAGNFLQLSGRAVAEVGLWKELRPCLLSDMRAYL